MSTITTLACFRGSGVEMGTRTGSTLFCFVVVGVLPSEYIPGSSRLRVGEDEGCCGTMGIVLLRVIE